ncbi:MAG: diguanylate cyclase domain-containing protein [Candidatus Limnocylindrales bacterium]
MSTSDPQSEDFQFRALMENTEDSIYFKDRDCRLLRVSRRMAVNLGFTDASELVGKTDIDLFGEAFGQRTFLEDTRIMESNEPIIGLVESRPVGPTGTNWTLTTKVALHDPTGAIVGLLGITREINELKRTELNLQHMATHDPLTGLPNRYLMTDRLNHTLAQSIRTGATFAVLFLDVDDFKAINDARGHEFGNLVLRAIGTTLVGTVRASDTVARIGGDEFVVILDSLEQGEHGGLVADKILRTIRKPFTLRRYKVKVTVSIGIGLFPRERQGCRGPARGGRLRDVPGQGRGQEPLDHLSRGPAGPEQGLRGRLDGAVRPGAAVRAASP